MQKQEFTQYKNIHCVGLGGIGVSAIARYFLSRGAKVSGSDRADFDQSKDLALRGVKVFTSHDEKNIPENTEAIIYSSAVPNDNPELVFADGHGIPMYEYVEALGEIMKGKYGIGVSGTNGKTTTTAMLGKILEEGKLDPLVVVGGKVPGWDANLRLPTLPRTAFGKEIFVAEACEYRRHFLKLSPKSIVLTNIEAEHLDYFKDIADIKSAFSEYVAKLPQDGFLVYNADDANVHEAVVSSPAKKISCALVSDADFKAANIHYENDMQVFEVHERGRHIGAFSIGVPGKFNVSNALEALALALSLGVDTESARRALSQFFGTWRRFQKVGTVGGTIIISDYAHHPAGVKATIEAAKELYPAKKMLFVFQPHQKDRTLKLLSEFAEALSSADDIILSEIYEVAGRNETEKNISSQDLAREIAKLSKTHVAYLASIKETEATVKNLLPSFDVVVIMGAGDVYKIAENLIQ